MIKISSIKNLSLFLWLVSAHSIMIGVGLILFPASELYHFGFIDYKESFFQAQGGVFHLAMSIAYIIAASNVEKSYRIIIFIIMVKLLAFIFLLIYYFLFLQSLMIFFSAIGDGMMGIIIFYLQRASMYCNKNKF